MSLPNVITLSIDEADDTNFVSHVFERYDDSALNRSLYIGPGHLPAEARNTLGFYRTPPKPNGNFKGVKKSSIKTTHDYSVLGVDGSTLTSPAIQEFNISLPVGLTNAQVLFERMKFAAIVAEAELMFDLAVVQHV